MGLTGGTVAKVWHFIKTPQRTSLSCSAPSETRGRGAGSGTLCKTANCAHWAHPPPNKQVGRRGHGSLTVHALLRVMVGATVGLLGLRVCGGRGLPPLAALPLTQGRHVEILQPHLGGAGGSRLRLITHTQDMIEA